MIAMLRGELFEKDLDGVILDVGGVGYRVDLPVSSLQNLPPTGEAVTLYIYTSVREDAIDLYGFTSKADKRVFIKLISVSGIGPRLALNALSNCPAVELVAAVLQGNLATLRAIKGVGKKTAERMILELRDPFKAMDLGDGVDLGPSGVSAQSHSGPGVMMLNDLHSALVNLGFSPMQADIAATAMRERAESMDMNELLRESLKYLRSGSNTN